MVITDPQPIDPIKFRVAIEPISIRWLVWVITVTTVTVTTTVAEACIRLTLKRHRSYWMQVHLPHGLIQGDKSLSVNQRKMMTSRGRD
jgi:hypothetical protein